MSIHLVLITTYTTIFNAYRMESWEGIYTKKQVLLLLLILQHDGTDDMKSTSCSVWVVMYVHVEGQALWTSVACLELVK